ncbi:MAG: hypothetical protein AAFN13_10265 [Bacteroidota bacterium]
MPTSNETAVAYANHELHGKDAVLHFVDGAREQGTVEYVEPQATAWWIRSDSLRIAPTSEIERIVFDNRAKTTLTGLAIGAGAGLLVALGASTLGGDADSAGEAFALGLGVLDLRGSARVHAVRDRLRCPPRPHARLFLHRLTSPFSDSFR